LVHRLPAKPRNRIPADHDEALHQGHEQLGRDDGERDDDDERCDVDQRAAIAKVVDYVNNRPLCQSGNGTRV
jgi:hypothetical protein